jgi:hypothetical protein
MSASMTAIVSVTVRPFFLARVRLTSQPRAYMVCAVALEQGALPMDVQQYRLRGVPFHVTKHPVQPM